jgi:phage host-nuclease inhibitor protein Gam
MIIHIKNKTTPSTTRAEIESLINKIAALKLHETELAAAMDSEIRDVRDYYEPQLHDVSVKLAERTEAARAWAARHPSEFAGKRSIQFANGVAGFRTGKPRLKLLARWTADRMLQALRDLSWGAGYIRVKEEINKEQIIADIGTGFLKPDDLRQAGARIVQDDTFYVEPALTRTHTRELAKAA